MQQLTQQLKSGQVRILEVPVPMVGPGEVLVRNHYSLISAGTEGSTVKAARKSLVGKAKERPQQVKQVLDVLKSQGPVQTYRAVMKKLEAYSPLGYSTSGEVVAIGPDVRNFAVGDKVACAGVTASHAEVIAVPVNLCVGLEETADMRSAAYNTLGAIALQGVRQADLRLGESCAVIGLGLLGQLTCLLLKAAGVKTLGIDVSDAAVKSAKEHAADFGWTRQTPGLNDLIASQTDGIGVDAVIITAATSSLDPINFAGEICRKRGRVVVVGAIPTGFDRDPYWYRKELELRMSCSYGPGRYDPQYEEQGIDYPAAYVRWTEKRNMQAFQEMIHRGQINLDYLTTHQFDLDRAGDAYEMILARSEPFTGILIRYDTSRTIEVDRPIGVNGVPPTGRAGISFIGAGSYAQSNLLPNLPESVSRHGVLTRSGTTSKRVADKYGFQYSAQSLQQLLEDTNCNTVAIATRHDSHAHYVQAALRAGKHVLTEKPLCLTKDELDEIARLWQQCDRQLMVGYNRRFSPHSIHVKKTLADGPKMVTYRVNAGALPADSWIQDPKVGGGRIIGEGCHFIDWMTWLCESVPTRVYACGLPDVHHHHDSVSVSVDFADGSIGTLHYVACGARGLPKERIEIHQAGTSVVLDDFRRTLAYGGRKPQTFRTRAQDKGQSAMLSAFFQRIEQGGAPLIAPEQIYAVMDACLLVRRSLVEKQPLAVSRFASPLD